MTTASCHIHRSLTLAVAIILSVIAATAQINIWQGHKGMPSVELTPYPAAGSGNIGVVVCPGGSYFWHDITTEGHDVARWLQSNGISAFVLKYRAGTVGGFITHYRLWSRGNRYPDPQNDLRQAIRLIKSRADEWHVDTTRVGAMGFSAGGHLVMSVALLDPQPATTPAFIAPIYPVVSFSDPCAHNRSARGLLGDDKARDRVMRDSLSLERHVRPDCPPVFLVNCVDDPIVHWRNSVLLDSALTANGVPHRYLLYQTGGHGFGASDQKGTAECRRWRDEFIGWIRRLYPVDGPDPK